MCSFQNPFASTLQIAYHLHNHVFQYNEWWVYAFGLVGLVCLAIASAICCSSSVGSSNNIMCLETEKHALLQFKQGLVDKSNALASWENKKDCCKWRGIACNNQTGHVTSLDFSFSYDPYHNSTEVPLRGTMIPKFIGSLSQLKERKLADANFSGPVPPQLGNLSNLHTLDLSENYDVRSENLEWLSHFSSLRYLNMSWLNLSETVNWPQSLSKLTSITELQLSSCHLHDVNLRSLFFIDSSTSLQVLHLSGNFFNSSIFYWIANVSSNFVHIDLSSNNLEGPIPDVFTSMLSLESLILYRNQLSENIEDSVKTLSCAENTLETLDLGANLFWGSLPDLSRFQLVTLATLQSTDYQGNKKRSSM
ncbi:receptor-like protein EIX1 [Rosa rugosa]|uniref:receptor-like protein EIX1 n=1 Tax=Rosa rugosa TaxID=74645 RepID=UPI002B403E3D|nr:receptor-like protein EIX1 [Rosa rugosa]